MPGQCRLLGGPAAAAAQLFLAGVAVRALVYKRHKERPQRSYRVWGMDVSKQMLSAVAAHLCGIAIAILASETGGRAVSGCAWYFVAYSFDTTLGIAIAIGLHKLAVRSCQRRLAAAGRPDGSRETWCRAVAECGDYGVPPRWQRFVWQLLEWTAAVLVARTICGSVVIGAKRWLVHIARALDTGFAGHPNALLFFVMILCPLVMNLVQALLTDAVLKLKMKAGSPAEEMESRGAFEAGAEVAVAPSKREREDVRLLATQPELQEYMPPEGESAQRSAFLRS